MNDLPAADLVHVALGRGADNAESIGSLAERLYLSRRQVEQAVQTLRLQGVAVASGRAGVWITDDPVDLWATYSGLRRRVISQMQTVWAVRKTARRLRDKSYVQETLFDPAA